MVGGRWRVNSSLPLWRTRGWSPGAAARTFLGFRTLERTTQPVYLSVTSAQKRVVIFTQRWSASSPVSARRGGTVSCSCPEAKIEEPGAPLYTTSALSLQTAIPAALPWAPRHVTTVKVGSFFILVSASPSPSLCGIKELACPFVSAKTGTSV